MLDDNFYMSLAIKQAEKAFLKNEVPVGAVIVDKTTGDIISTAYNKVEKKQNACAHAEMLAIKKACKIRNSKVLENTKIYVSKEPCSMCATAISYARIPEVIFALDDKKGGAVLYGSKLFETQKNLFKPTVKHGIMAEQSKELLQKFFKAKR